MAHRGLARAPGAGVPVNQAIGVGFGGDPVESGQEEEGRSAEADYAMGVSLPSVPAVSLGSSGIPVSRLALGSWRTYERISRDQGIRVMQTAREAGITFLDDARYNDETGRAPIPTGYSEVVFGELFRAAGWHRDDTIVSNKLWWEFWPDESPAEELAGSLARMRLDYIDLIYAEVPPDGVALEDAIGMITGLIRAGTARAWGTLNWTPEQMERAWQIADREGVPGPAATQPPYSLVQRDIVEDPGMQRLAAARNVAIVASYTLAGGVLTGKYDQDPGAGRAAGMLDQPRVAPAVAAGRDLAALARDVDTDPASLAMAFALLNPSVTTVLFGATRPEQVSANLQALAVADQLMPDERDRLAAIGVRR
jgi:L-glyceraldehyde 3-phosphate reductase